MRPTHVEVYLYSRSGRGLRILLLRRSTGQALPGVWQPVTGRIRRGERATTAAAREVREETGLVSRSWRLLEPPTLYYDVASDRIQALPLFVAEIPADSAARLSSEHDAARWLAPAAAARRVLWDSQRRAIETISRGLRTSRQLNWREIPARSSQAARLRRATRG